MNLPGRSNGTARQPQHEGAPAASDTAADGAWRAACASRRRTVGLVVPAAGLRGWVLDGLHAQAMQGDGSHWQGCDFAGACFDGARLRQARLEACSLVGSRWIALDAIGLQAPGSDWSGAVVEDSQFDGAALAGADFSAAWLTDSGFARANLDGACFEEAQADGVSFRGASAVGARYMGSRLAGADFRGADLRDAVFSAAHLEGADFRGATLDGANFDGARCSGARFDLAPPTRPGQAPQAAPGTPPRDQPPLDTERLEALLAPWLAPLPHGTEAAREPMALLTALLQRAGLLADAARPLPAAAGNTALAPLLDLLRALETGDALPSAPEPQWQALVAALFPALADAPDAPDWEALAQVLARTPPTGAAPRG